MMRVPLTVPSGLMSASATPARRAAARVISVVGAPVSNTAVKFFPLIWTVALSSGNLDAWSRRMSNADTACSSAQ